MIGWMEVKKPVRTSRGDDEQIITQPLHKPLHNLEEAYYSQKKNKSALTPEHLLQITQNN